MWNTWIGLAGLATLPLSALGTAFAFNVLATLGVALSGWTAFLMIRRYVRNVVAAIAGGLVYGFSPYMMAQSRGHLHLTLAFTPPLFLLLVDDLVVRQRHKPVRDGVLLGVLAAAQLLTGEEILAMSALTAVIALIWLAILNRHQIRAHMPHALRGFAWGAITFAVLAAWPLAVQLRGPYRPTGLLQQPNHYVSDLAGFVVPTKIIALAPASALHLTMHFTGNHTEWNAYVGIPLLLIIAWTGVRLRRRGVVALSVLMFLSAAVLSLGPRLHVVGRDTGIHLPWRALASFPFFINALPARMMLFADLFAALLLAVFLEDTLRSSPGRILIGATAGALVLASLFPRLPYPYAPVATTPRFFTNGDLRRLPVDAAVLVVPMATGPGTNVAMIWHQDAKMRFRMVGGYLLGTFPVYSLVWTSMKSLNEHGVVPPITEPVRAEFLTELDAWHVRAVVIGPWSREGQSVVFLTDILGRRPETLDGVEVWWR
jgi:hypothetical protein